MNNYEKHAWAEFRAAGWVDENNKFNDEMQEMVCTHVLKLLDVFHGEGHSGSSASYTINMFKRLSSFEPIAPLTGEDWEWSDVGEQSGYPLWQNKRCGSIFKDNNGAYDTEGIVFWEWYKNDEGEMSKTYYIGKGSIVPVTFPYIKPEKPEYQFRPSEEYPNEVL